MCGICGIINFNSHPVEEAKIRTMMQKMKHRGPDDEGIFFDSNIGLGFVRLSIIDLTPLGHQPMFAEGKEHRAENGGQGAKGREHRAESGEQGRYVIVYNGEVYNYIELREELRGKGYQFKSNTDTEVVLNAYIQWGEECLHKFNGMWAIAIYDRQRKELFCARDRFGIKPFYYYTDDEQFIFASEIPPIIEALHAMRHAPCPMPNYQAIFDYLIFNRTDQTEDTFFEGIKKLQHGHLIRLRNGDCGLRNERMEIRRWYDLKERIRHTDPFKSSKEYREIFSSAVGLRLRSDVPVGVCLSGGLDSSSIVSVLLKDHKFEDLNTFSAVYGKGKRGDESDFINEYKGTVKNMHYTSPNADTLYDDMACFITAHGEPIPSTAPYAQFKVMELAKDNVVVTLDGQGADEELAGYHYFFGFYFKDLFRKFRWFRFFSEIYYYLKIHRSIYGLKTLVYFLMPAFLKTKARIGEKGYLNPEFVGAYSKNNKIAGELYNSGSLNEALLDHFEHKIEHLLKWEDRNSMWFSLESRVPFLDYRLVEKTLASAANMKIKSGMTKHILREAMRGTLPEKIRIRKDKIGFMTPEDEWFRDEKFRIYIFELLNSESFRSRKIIDAEKAKQLYKKHLNKEIQISKEIWKWINLELWFREFVDGGRRAEGREWREKG